MRFRVTVTDQHTFAKPQFCSPSYIDNPDHCKNILLYSNGDEVYGDTDAWHLRINDAEKQISCIVHNSTAPLMHTLCTLPLRPGVIILDNLGELFDKRAATGTLGTPLDAKVRSFRTTEFQQFLDKYGITAYCRTTPNRYYGDYVTSPNTPFSQTWELDRIVSDGEQQPYEEYGDLVSCLVRGATWAIITSACGTSPGYAPRRILFTRKRDLEALEASFKEKGVLSA